jgi:4-hydroxybenzoate polyprenyltransferase
MSGQAGEPVVRLPDEEYGWLVRLPRGWRDYGLLARLDRPIGTWLLFIPCLWGLALAGGTPAMLWAPLMAIGAIAMRGAGCTINDMADRDFDRRVARTAGRPLAAGRLRMKQAMAFLALQLAIGLGVLLFLPLTAALIALCSMPLVIAYPFMKRITYWPQVFLGLTFNWGVLVGYAASMGGLGLPALFLYLAGIAWTLGYDTIYAHQDKEDDALIGVKSTALLFGEATRPWLYGFYAAMLGLLVLAGWSAGLGPLFFLALLPVAGLLAWQVQAVDLDDPADCLDRFRSHRGLGLLVGVALLLGHWQLP